jgi:hypothetical protein
MIRWLAKASAKETPVGIDKTLGPFWNMVGVAPINGLPFLA